MISVPTLSAPVAAVIEAAPHAAQKRLMAIRALIFDTAHELDVGPLTETLKWGEPAYLTEASKSGTTLRLGWKAAQPDLCALYVNCRTDLIDRYREQYPTEFDYDGDRAVLLPLSEPLPELPLRRIVGMAMTYHRDKPRQRSGIRR